MEQRIIYIYDALCGWCYGFSPEVKKLEKTWRDKLPFEVLSGGMVPATRAHPLSTMAAYIKNAHKQVEQLSGVKFGSAFLNDTLNSTTLVMNSEPPALALSIAKKHYPELGVSFAHEIQYSFYYEGHDLNAEETYKNIAKKLDMQTALFSNFKENEQAIADTIEEFRVVQHLGVSGFPSLLLQQGEQLQWLSRGYSSYEQINEKLSSLVGTTVG